MILKIMRYKVDEPVFIYDNISRISIRDQERCEWKQDTYFHIEILDKPEKDRFAIINCILKNDSEISIAFDTMAYLLNDDGKTIEKIVANYND